MIDLLIRALTLAFMVWALPEFVKGAKEVCELLRDGTLYERN